MQEGRERQQRDDRSIGELLAELSQKTTTLVRQEIQLAKAELTQKASRVGKDVGFLLVGGVVAYTGVLALVAAGIILLGSIIPYWLSAAIVGFVIAAVGLVLVLKGAKALRQEDPTPRETLETLQEDKEWLKDRTR
jgi:uncharacterized membrane protein YqjE